MGPAKNAFHKIKLKIVIASHAFIFMPVMFLQNRQTRMGVPTRPSALKHRLCEGNVVEGHRTVFIQVFRQSYGFVFNTGTSEIMKWAHFVIHNICLDYMYHRCRECSIAFLDALAVVSQSHQMTSPLGLTLSILGMFFWSSPGRLDLSWSINLKKTTKQFFHHILVTLTGRRLKPKVISCSVRAHLNQNPTCLRNMKFVWH